MAQNDYCVIGMGRFGTEVANYLASEGKKVLIIDNEKRVIERFRQEFNYAIIADATNREVLEEIGIWKINAVIVCVSNIETSATICYNLRELDVKNVMARAKNNLHKKILNILGIKYSVIPEVIVGKQLGFRAIYNVDTDIININKKVILINLVVTNEKLTDRPLESLDLRKNGVNIITIERNENVIFPITPQTCLNVGDYVSIVCEIGKVGEVVKIFTNASKQLFTY